MSVVTLLVVLLPMPTMGRLSSKLEPLAVKKDEHEPLLSRMQADMNQLSVWLGESEMKSASAGQTRSVEEDAKCDQACANGSEGHREACVGECEYLQTVICKDGFTCLKGCNNHMKDKDKYPKDMGCEKLCDHVSGEICDGLGYEAPKGAVSPHHDEEVPPSIEATPAPRIYTGSSLFCNAYPSGYEFQVMALKSPKDKDGPVLTSLAYKQCDKIPLETLQFIGLKAKGVMAGVSKPIVKVPSVMLFGQSAFGNHQVEFNRYFAQSDGPMLCNGFPIWYTKQVGQSIEFQRDGKKITTLKYKDCYPTSLKNGEVLSAWVKGQKIGEYRVIGSPSAVVLGKAGQTTAVAFEAWTDNEV